MPSIAIEEPSRLATCHTLPGLSSGWLSCCLSSHRRFPYAGTSHCGIAFCASRLSGWLSRLLAFHAATSHLPVPPPSLHRHLLSRPSGTSRPAG